MPVGKRESAVFSPGGGQPVPEEGADRSRRCAGHRALEQSADEENDERDEDEIG